MIENRIMPEDYFDIQEKYESKYGKDKTILLMAVGSFHEAYSTKVRGPNLDKISELLNIARTMKNKKKPLSESNPYMLGVPTSALYRHLKRLVTLGYTVVVIDQVTPAPDPIREITGIYSEGTFIDGINGNDSNNIISLYIRDEIQQDGSVLLSIGMSSIDLSTGECSIHEAYATKYDQNYSLDEAIRFINNNDAKEIIIKRHKIDDKYKDITMSKNDLISYLEIGGKKIYYQDQLDKKYGKLSYIDKFLREVYKSHNFGMLSILEYLDIEIYGYAIISFVVLLSFAHEHDIKLIDNIFLPKVYNNKNHMVLGNSAIYQLNIFSNNGLETINKSYNSLLDVVDNTSTAMGRRYLKEILSMPLLSKTDLDQYYLYTSEIIKDDYRKYEEKLSGILDLDRLLKKLSIGRLHPYELLSFKESYDEVISILEIISKNKKFNGILPPNKKIDSLKGFIEDFNNIFNEDEMHKFMLNDISRSIFKEGVYEDIDELQEKIEDGMNFMSNIVTKFSKLINNKKKDIVKLENTNKGGYYISLTQNNYKILLSKLPKKGKIKISKFVQINIADLRDKNNITELKSKVKINVKELDDQSDKVIKLESDFKTLIYQKMISYYEKIFDKYNDCFRIFNKFITKIDYIKSNAKTAILYNYTKPEILGDYKNGQSCINCKGLRHPLVERIRTNVEYVPHDISLGNSGQDNYINGMLVYGLNASGKSTLMKAIGCSIIMAQAGMYVPATSFKYVPYTGLYARISGNDNIYKNLSSYTLEMTELRAILRRTNKNTLVIGDEICRGTEHKSANAIVSAGLIKLTESECSFIFATHLHEIPNMEKIKQLDRMKTFHLTVKHDRESNLLVYDRKLKEGPGYSDYGILVAQFIINDDDFISLAKEIKRGMDNNKEILPDKQSKYNKDVYMNECQVCHEKYEELDTHHINYQKDCKNKFVKNKPHLPMNNEANLANLCKKCHRNEHNGELNIKGYLDTSNGPILDYDKEGNKESNNRKKYSDEDIKMILKLKDMKNITQIRAKKILENKHDISISTNTIGKIWKNKY